jgi:hypothetical protein
MDVRLQLRPVVMKPVKSAQSLTLLGIQVGHLPSSVQFLICAAGVFIFHVYHGYLQVCSTTSVLSACGSRVRG